MLPIRCSWYNGTFKQVFADYMATRTVRRVEEVPWMQEVAGAVADVAVAVPVGTETANAR